MSKVKKRPEDPVLLRIKELVAKQAKIQMMMHSIDLEIKRLLNGQAGSSEGHTSGGTDADDGDPGAVERNSQGLPFLIHEILLDQRLALKDLVAVILRAGYKTKSKNFVTCVQQAIQLLKNVQAVKQDEKTRQYSAVRLSKNVLARRLSEQNKAKREARTRKEDG